MAAVAESAENVGVGEQVALLIDEESVAEERVVIAARGWGFVEAVDDGADAGIGGCILRRSAVSKQAERAGNTATEWTASKSFVL